MENTYTFELTKEQKLAGFAFLAIHSMFFLNVALDFLYFT